MKIVSIVGARPQFIKAKAVSEAIKQNNRDGCEESIEEVLVHTGQHYDENMSKVFFDELAIPKPDYNLGIGSGLHGVQTGRMLEAIEGVFLKESPDWVIVYGDTNSTLAGALAAKKLGLRIAHVEAGLRSFNMNMPEEINRVITDRISDLLFCPTATSVANLFAEGFKNLYMDGELIKSFSVPIAGFPLVANVGDVMYDASLLFKELAKTKSGILSSLGLAKKGYALATVHRAENTDNGERLRDITDGLLGIAEELPVVFPVHPRTMAAMKREGIERRLNKCKSVYLLPPLPYLDMIFLEQSARVVITDSGGVQKEAFFYEVPCITVRDETEWIETVEAGMNILTGTNPEKIKKALKETEKSKSSGKKCSFYGYGKAAASIIACLKETQ